MKKYNDKELRYAATARCVCGGGMAYPEDGSQPDEKSVFRIASEWFCSEVLKKSNRAIAFSGKHDVFPFSFYEIKSEKQPSANCRTTRPDEEKP